MFSCFQLIRSIKLVHIIDIQTGQNFLAFYFVCLFILTIDFITTTHKRIACPKACLVKNGSLLNVYWIIQGQILSCMEFESMMMCFLTGKSIVYICIYKYIHVCWLWNPHTGRVLLTHWAKMLWDLRQKAKKWIFLNEV